MSSAPILLTIAGTDPSSGGGIQADLQVFRDFGAHGVSVLTAVLWQDSRTVHGWHIPPVEVLRHQLEILLADLSPAAVKLGVLPTPEAVACVAELLPEGVPVVHDPVLSSGDGRHALVTPGTLEAMRERLFPRLTLLTPNLPEVAALLDLTPQQLAAHSLEELAREARHTSGVRNLLLKVGHAAPSEDGMMRDWLATPAHTGPLQALPRHAMPEARGTGCHLSSAICALLARGASLEQACDEARRYLAGLLLSHTSPLGHGKRLITHLDPSLSSSRS